LFVIFQDHQREFVIIGSLSFIYSLLCVPSCIEVIVFGREVVYCGVEL